MTTAVDAVLCSNFVVVDHHVVREEHTRRVLRGSLRLLISMWDTSSDLVYRVKNKHTRYRRPVDDVIFVVVSGTISAIFLEGSETDTHMGPRLEIHERRSCRSCALALPF